MVGAREDGSAALVIAAHLHAAMPARVEEHMHLAGPVAAQDHRFLAHRRHKEITGVRDLALGPDKQPGAGEYPLLLLAVDLVIDKDLAADLPGREIDQTGPVCFRLGDRHGLLLASST